MSTTTIFIFISVSTFVILTLLVYNITCANFKQQKETKDTDELAKKIISNTKPHKDKSEKE